MLGGGKPRDIFLSNTEKQASPQIERQAAVA